MATRPETPDAGRRRDGRNRAVGLALLAFVVLIFIGSLVKMANGHLPVLNVEIGRER